MAKICRGIELRLVIFEAGLSGDRGYRRSMEGTSWVVPLEPILGDAWCRPVKGHFTESKDVTERGI